MLFLKLLTAHLAGDYLFQSSRVARGKVRPALLGAHLLAHGALLALVGLTEPASLRLWLALLGVLLAHAAIDAWTSRMASRNLRILALDQSLHLATLVAGALVVMPDQAGEALHALLDVAWRPDPWLLASGVLLAVPAGATVVGRMVQPFREALVDESHERQQGLEQAGKWIGMLERFIVFLAVIGRAESLIGFVIAAKAVLRLPEAREAHSRKLAEYYLVGSLASLAWALVVAFGVRMLVASSLGI
jgi:hypothetical protein